MVLGMFDEHEFGVCLLLELTETFLLPLPGDHGKFLLLPPPTECGRLGDHGQFLLLPPTESGRLETICVRHSGKTRFAPQMDVGPYAYAHGYTVNGNSIIKDGIYRIHHGRISYAGATPAVMLSPKVVMAAEGYCQRPPAGAQSLANYLHDASRWLVIAVTTAGLNITAGVASQRILTRRILV